MAADEGGSGLWPSGRAGGGCCSSLLGESVTLNLSLIKLINEDMPSA